jgi:lipopolysaccharide exporter
VLQKTVLSVCNRCRRFDWPRCKQLMFVTLPLSKSQIVVLTTAMTSGIRLAGNLLLARLVTPDSFGVIGIVFSILYCVAMMSDLGFQAYILRSDKSNDPKFLDEVWTIRVIRAFVLAMIVAASAPITASFFGHPELESVVLVCATLGILESFGSLALITALKTDNVKTVCLTDVVVTLVQSATGVIAAFYLHNYWALVSAMFTGHFVRVILSYMCFVGAYRRFSLTKAALIELWGFGKFIVPSSMITMLLTQVDRIVYAKVLPLETFGLFVVAANLASVPLIFVTDYVAKVIYPTFVESMHLDSKVMSNKLYESRVPVLWLFSCATGLLSGLSGIIFSILYDDRYAGSSFFFSVLMLNVLLFSVSWVSNEFLIAIGLVKTTLVANVIRLVTFALFAGTGYLALGVRGLVVGGALVELGPIVYYFVVLKKCRYLQLRREMYQLGVGALSALVGFATSFGLLALR